MPIHDAAEAQRYGRELLVGERVRLRPLREDDLPALESWWEDPATQPMQQAGVRPRPAGSAAERLRGWSANADGTAAGFSVETLDTAALAGHVTVWGAKLPERAAELAVMVGPEHAGAGLGPDAVSVMLRYCFLQMGLNRVELRVWATNDRARRACARAGFAEEGIRRQVAFMDGAFLDEVMMAVLREEWTP